MEAASLIHAELESRPLKRPLRLLVLTKRQYTNKDLLDDRFGRIREIPFALSKQGHRVVGCCLSYARRSEGWFRDGSVIWRSVNVGRIPISGLVWFIAEADRMASRADVIWACSDSFYGVIGYLLGKKHGIPLVFDLYDNFEFFLAAKFPLLKQLYRHVVRNCDAVTCASEPLVERVEEYGRNGRACLLENAVRVDLFKPFDKVASRLHFDIPINAIVIGTAGALDTSRGIDRLFNAYFQLKRAYPNLYLAIAGHLGKNIRIPKDTEIRYLGALNFKNVPLFLNALDVAVVCNLDNEFGRYCFPQKAREIMACEVPIVAAAVGSLKYMLKDRPEWLYDPNDSQTLVNALEKRFRDRRTGYSGLISWDDVASKLEEILLKISKQTRKKRVI
jgi:glycosyltransferase involved in cell wall biosynthesis